jgi:hypothetical protein
MIESGVVGEEGGVHSPQPVIATKLPTCPVACCILAADHASYVHSSCKDQTVAATCRLQEEDSGRDQNFHSTPPPATLLEIFDEPR